MIESLAARMAEGIKRRAPDHPASVAVLKHSLAILINSLAIISFSLIAGVITGHIKETVTILIAFALLRMVSGGLHLKSGSMCVLVTTSLFVLLSLVKISDGLGIVLNSISLILVILFAPTDIKKQSRIPEKYYPLLKFLSAAMIISSFWIDFSTITACFFVQSLMLIPRREVK